LVKVVHGRFKPRRQEAYQSLPRSVLAELTPLVNLDWSTNAYHDADLSQPPFYYAITNAYQPRS
jgi:hypothetical protein